MNKDAISQAIVYLFEKEMFYAEILATMKRKVFRSDIPWGQPGCFMAGVCIKEQIELHINQTAFEKLPVEQRAAVLKHECEHILRNHIFRMRELAPEVYKETKEVAEGFINSMKHKAMNVAADCAVNSFVQQLPDQCIYPEQFKLIRGETFEWYMDQLKDNDKMKGLTEFDDHSLWNESEGDKEVLKEKVKQAINQAASKARAAGRMTAENEFLVSGFNKPLVNWKDQLRRFVAKTIETKLESSRKKRNRRYGIMFPGTVKIEELHIGVAMDTSGSVSDESLTQFLTEINGIAKYAKVTVVEADCQVKDSYIFDPKKKYKVKGRGGTAYQPAFTYFTEETNVDAVIYFGDMDTSDSVQKPRYPVLWAIVGMAEPPADFGSMIRVKKDN